jgi:membrane fusion protein, multidrug efflux system
MTRFGCMVVGSCIVVAACAAPKGDPALAAEVRQVRTAKVATSVAERTLTAVGTLQPVARVSVAAQEEGVVHKVLVREGDTVRKGQLLVQLDDRQLSAQLAEAEASTEEAQARWRRTQALRVNGLLSAAEEDTSRAAARIAEARSEVLKTRLGFTRIASPVDGVVVARHVEVGDLASPRSPLLELASGHGLLLRVPVSELEVVHIAPGDLAHVTVDALPELALAAHVTRIFPSADPTSRQVTVELKVDDVPPAVRIGFLARAHLVLERRPDSVVIPEDAVQRGSEIPTFVWIADGDHASMRAVSPGWRLDDGVVISSGLAAGDELIVEGRSGLREGTPIARMPEQQLRTADPGTDP